MARRRGLRARFAHVYDSPLWPPARAAALNRDNWTCTACGRWGNHAHHVVPLHRGGAPYALDNLAILCKRCHADVHADLRQPSAVAGRDEWRAALRDFGRGA